MRNAITVHNNAMPLVEFQGQRVVTFAMVDEVHQRPDGLSRRTFNRNRRHFIEGEDFVKISAEQYRAMKVCAGVKDSRKKAAEKITEDVTLLFESGYLMLVKPFQEAHV